MEFKIVKTTKIPSSKKKSVEMYVLVEILLKIKKKYYIIKNFYFQSSSLGL